MKKSTTLLLIMSFALLVLSGCKEKKNEPAAEVPVQSVTLSKTSYVFTDLGETLQLKATVLPEDATNPKVTWASSKTEVATVSDNGLVTSVGNGTSTIVATADG
ncbi:MAG: Ig-like domain-containing protein, partial [Paludibacteraceae bacterium]|nr:Ig-like domain-containing protein [Paludibacteraceae bacterium]